VQYIYIRLAIFFLLSQPLLCQPRETNITINCPLIPCSPCGYHDDELDFSGCIFGPLIATVDAVPRFADTNCRSIQKNLGPVVSTPGNRLKNSLVRIDDEGNVELNGIIKNGIQINWPSTFGPAGTFLESDGTGNLVYAYPSGGGSGNVDTALPFTAENLLVRTDTASGPTNIQESGITLDNSNNISGVNTLTATTVVANLIGNATTATTATTATNATNFTGPLSGDVTGTQAHTVVSFVGGQTAANVAAGAVAANAATSANIPFTIVERDAAGNFSATDITANLLGNATTATTATTSILAISATDFTGPLIGDVTGTQNATVVSLVDGVSAANVASGANAANAATSANIPLTIVERDAAGNFSATDITATLLGNATTATTATSALSALSAIDFTGPLLGDVTGTQGATVVALVDGVTAANVASGANAANAATSANVFNTIVKRDAAGNFSATDITATLLGNATTATTATTSISAISAIDFTGPLIGDVTGTQNATVVSLVDGVSAANVASGANAANAATSANVFGTIVKRDAAGNFSATDITATLIGSATLDLPLTGGTLTGPLEIPGGSTGSPSLTFSNSGSGTGISAPVADTLSFDINGTGEVMNISGTSGGTVIIDNFTTAGVVHNTSGGVLFPQLIEDPDIAEATITNDKLANISSSNIPGDIVVRDSVGDFITNMITITGTPTNPTDVATVSYVNTAVSLGLVAKAPVQVVATSPVTLSGLYAIDGVPLGVNYRVLTVAQTDENPVNDLGQAVSNGIWLAQTGPWTYPADWVPGTDADQAYVLVLQGMVNAGSSWLCNTPTAIIGTDNVGFVEFSLPNQTTAANLGDGAGTLFINKTGITLNFKTIAAGSHIDVINDPTDVTIATDATSANTFGTIVSRDSVGDFVATNITANLTGNATTATTSTNFTGSLIGDVTGTQGATVVSLVDGVTAANVASGAIAANAATSANIPLTIVERDAAGNFSATDITATLLGNATTATTSISTISAIDFTGPLVGDVTGTQGATVVSLVGGVTAANLASGANAANAATSANVFGTIVKRDAAGNFSATDITATLFGNATTATTSTNFTGPLIGDVTGTQGATVVSLVDGVTAANVASGANAANAATSANVFGTIVERDAAGNFSATDITATLFGNATTATSATTALSAISAIDFTGPLIGDVTGTQGATVVALVDGVTAANIAAGANAANAATSANVFGTIVKRDAAGNFSATDITATLLGNATTATTSTNFTGSLTGDVTGTQGATVVALVDGVTAANVASGAIAANAATSANIPLTIVERDATGNFSATDITATFTGNLTGNVTGNLTGNASTATTAINFSGPLLGDVTGSQALTVVAKVGGVTAANVASGANAANAATSANVASTIVERDAAGNFSATDITATLLGNATTATSATTSISTISAIDFTGPLLGDVTGTQSATVVAFVDGVTAANVASGANAANAATSANVFGTIVERDAAGNFSATDITATLIGSATLDLPLTGGTLTGPLEIPGGSTGSPSLTFSNSSSGTGISAPVANTLSFDISGAEAMNIGTTGNVTIDNSLIVDGTLILTSPLTVANGGTGDTTLLAHGVLIGEGTNPVNVTAAGTAGQVFLGNSASTDPTWVTPTAGNGLTVTANATTLSFGISAPIIVANGGTGDTTLTAHGVLLGEGTSPIVATAVGTNGQVLIGSSGADPAFATLTSTTGTIAFTPGAHSLSLDVVGGAAIDTIAGNTGTATGPTVTITTGANNAQGTALFTGAGSTLTETFTTATGNNTGIGLSALDSLTSGINNTAFGSAALNFNTTGSNNTAVGYSSMLGAISALDNVALGVDALTNLVGGTYNIALGTYAGSNLDGLETSDIYIGNVGVAGESNTIRIGTTGSGAGQQNSTYIAGNVTIAESLTVTDDIYIPTSTASAGNIVQNGTIVFSTYYSGSNNLFIGPNAGQIPDVTGTQNVGVGANALGTLVSGGQNAALGVNALQKNITGTQNVAVGFESMQLNQIGEVNTAVGYQALQAATGNSNTMIGANAGSGITTGAGNTGIGANAFGTVALGSSAITNIAIGSAAGYQIGTSSNSNIYINSYGASESNTLRVGVATGTGTQDLAAAYICGIEGVNIGSVASVVTIGGTNANQLGEATITAGTGIAVTPGASTITIGLTTPVSVANGGTGDTTLPIHSLLIGEGTGAIGNPGTGTAGQIIVSGGSSADPAWVTPTAGTGLTVIENATTHSYALTVPVTVANGGTGDTTLPANAVLLGNGTGAIATTAVGTTGQVLTGVTGSAPTFQAPAASSISITGNSGTVTGAAFTITTGAANAQGTALFTGAGTTLTETFTTATGNNTGIGLSALDSLAGGINNTAFGSGALNLNTTGGDNTAVGYQALQANLSGSNNTAVGYQALTASIGSGGNGANTAVGMNSMKAMTSGVNNTAIGYGSLTGATTAGENAAFGFNVFPSLTSGTYNMGMGINSGTNYTGAESSNIIINAPGTLGESNVLRIGTATGTGVQDLKAAYIAGITGTSAGSLATLTTIASTGQLGATTLTAGTGITITPAASTLTVGLTTPITVAEGGTGDTSLTAYAVLTGGTTSTGPVQSIASVGTSGQILTSNGAGALPTFQAPAASSISITGNTGTVTGAAFTITTGAANAQGTALFTGSGSTLTETFTDANNNTGIGLSALDSLTSGIDNTASGSAALNLNTTGGSNTAVGYEALQRVVSGSYNTAVGVEAGFNYTTSESSNVSIGTFGTETTGESNVTRIGGGTGTGNGQQSKAFICGINGANVGAVAKIVAINGDQLGSATITAGTGITVTPTANTITIASPAAGSLVLLASISASSSATISFTSAISSTYSTYFMTWELVQPSTNLSSLEFLVSTNNGTSYITTNYQSGLVYIPYNSVTATNSTSTTVGLLSQTTGNTSYTSGNLWMYNVQNGGTFQAVGESVELSSATTYRMNYCCSNTATMVNAIQFLFSAGNITSGKFSLYGLTGS
jgi:trimeric autotransporter adhesin